MTTADRLSARTVHTNPEHEDPHKDPKRTETSTARGKPGRQRARRRHARCFPRPAARYQQCTVLKIQGASSIRTTYGHATQVHALMRLPLSRSIPSQDGDDGSWAVGRSSISLARSRAFGCRGFTSVCRSSASVLSPATRHVCPVCFASHSDARLRPSSTCTATPAALGYSRARTTRPHGTRRLHTRRVTHVS